MWYIHKMEYYIAVKMNCYYIHWYEWISQKQCWVKNTGHKGVHIIRFHLYDVRQHAAIHGAWSWDSEGGVGGNNQEEAQIKVFWGLAMLYFLTWVVLTKCICFMIINQCSRHYWCPIQIPFTHCILSSADVSGGF